MKAVLIKVAQVAPDGDIVRIVAPPWRGVEPCAGDRAFLWWSESHGGAGLAAHGWVATATRTGRDWALDVEIVGSTGRFAKADLAPFRDDPGTSPSATLARALFRHSHHKVMMMDPAVVRFLDGLP